MPDASPSGRGEQREVGHVIAIKPMTAMAEFDRCVELQVQVWGYSDGDVVPRRMFVLAERIGGQVLGAVVQGVAGAEAIVGFAMALPGYRAGAAYLHSHMLAVLPAYRNAGLGRRLKLAQREEALQRGFALMEWTFDPLEIKNAYLNLARLGAICRRYQRDFYGPSSSPLQGGLPTDRLVAEWWLGSEHVRRRLANEPQNEAVRVRVDVPAGVPEWKRVAADRPRARAAQNEVREQLQAGFSRGLTATGYERDAAGNGAYLLGEWTEPGAGAH